MAVDKRQQGIDSVYRGNFGEQLAALIVIASGHIPVGTPAGHDFNGRDLRVERDNADSFVVQIKTVKESQAIPNPDGMIQYSIDCKALRKLNSSVTRSFLWLFVTPTSRPQVRRISTASGPAGTTLAESIGFWFETTEYEVPDTGKTTLSVPLVNILCKEEIDRMFSHA